MNTNNSQFIAYFNQQEYYFKVTLYNGSKASAPLELSYIYVDELSIEETIYNWYSTAYIVLRNEYELFERGDSETFSPYIFRHDARNKINIRIYPILEDSLESLHPEHWELNYDFVVYNIEDLPSNSLSEKKKKLYLWDERYQHFLERNIQWSTYYAALEKQKISNSSASQTDGTCKVGEAIKHLIRTACGETDINKASAVPLRVGWSVDNSKGIISPDLHVAKFNDSMWDDGASNNTVFYTSPATYSVIDDLNYLLHLYVSGENQSNTASAGMPGILRLDRYTKKWELTGIDKLFKFCTDGSSSGTDVIERLYIQMPQENSLDNVAIKTPTKISDSLIRDINAGPTSTILSYKFSSMSSLDDMGIANRPIINYNNSKNIWNLFYKDNTAKSVKDTIKREILPNYFNGDTAGVLLGLNKDKELGYNTKPIHTVVQGDFVNILARNEMIYKSVLLNQALEFEALGLTIRTPGKFFIVDMQGSIGSKDNLFENKFLGQWLIAKATHTFYGDRYTTNTISIKINSFVDLPAFMPENDEFNE